VAINQYSKLPGCPITCLKVGVKDEGFQAPLDAPFAFTVAGSQEELDVTGVEGVLVDVLELVHTMRCSHKPPVVQQRPSTERRVL
jgi:hypothetical protein